MPANWLLNKERQLRRAYKWLPTCLCLIASAMAAYSADLPSAEVLATGVCTPNRTVNLGPAREVDNVIRGNSRSTAELVQLRSGLRYAVATCTAVINPAEAAFLAGLYIDIGDAFFSQRQYDEAAASYNDANALFLRFPYPNGLWLQALRGESLAELSQGRKVDAERISADQVAMARAWVKDKNIPVEELRYALRFQTDLCQKSGNEVCSKSSKKEEIDIRETTHR
jgi:hypothetical protein